MKNTITSTTFFIIFLLLFSPTSYAQVTPCYSGFGTNTATGQPCMNTINTSVPYLRITPDARSAGMGDVVLVVVLHGNWEMTIISTLS